jgi:predicted outer membrane repeat protein
VSRNTATPYGGGIFNDVDGTLVLNDQAAITGNTATYDGGGIFNDGVVTLNDRAAVSRNTASGAGSEGGGIWNEVGTVTLNGAAAVSQNTADYAGGIDNYDTLILNGQATVTRNTASVDGGGIYNRLDATVSLHAWATVTFNTAHGGAESGGGIYNIGTLDGAVAGFRGNVFGNRPDDIAP